MAQRPPGELHICGFDLKIAFEPQFKGTYKRASTTRDLQACIQKKSETSREYLSRCLETRNACEKVDDTTAMLSFIGGIHRGGLLRHKLTCEYNDQKLNLNKMICIASIHTTAEDDVGRELPDTTLPLHQLKKNNGNNERKNPPDEQKIGRSDMVSMRFQRVKGRGRGRGRGGGAGRGQQRANKVMSAGTRAPKLTKSTGTWRA
jgi:hypothetical protein